VIGSVVYPAAGHPNGSGSRPWYQVRGSLAFPVDGHPSGASAEAAFCIDDGRVYPAGTEPDDDRRPWFDVGPPAE
jgi:hypothetical protein